MDSIQEPLFISIFENSYRDKIGRFRYFYPSEIRCLCEYFPNNPLVIARIYSALIRRKKIKRTGNFKNTKTGGGEWEYETIQ